MLHQIKAPLPVAVIGSTDLYLAVRAAFVARGTTLNAWCIAHGVNRQTAERSLKGERGGRLSRELRARIVAELFPHAA